MPTRRALLGFVLCCTTGCQAGFAQTKSAATGRSAEKGATESEPEQLFRAMEKKLLEAEAIRFSFQGEFKEKKGAGQYSGTVLLASQNKARTSLVTKLTSQTTRMELVSDGVRSRFTSRGKAEDSTADTPKYLNECLVTLFERQGIFVAQMTMNFTELRSGTAPAKALEKQAFPLSDFQLGANERVDSRECRRIQFKCGEKAEERIPVSLWIDAKSMLPVQFKMESPSGSSFLETYRDFTLNATIDPKEFNP